MDVTSQHAPSTSTTLTTLMTASRNGKLPAWWSQADENLVVTLGTKRKDWDDIAKRLPGRTANSCRQRYYLLRSAANLRESEKMRLKWTPEEDTVLDNLRNQRMHWCDIAKRLPNRDEDSCRNRYYLRKRRHLSTWTEDSCLGVPKSSLRAPLPKPAAIQPTMPTETSIHHPYVTTRLSGPEEEGDAQAQPKTPFLRLVLCD